MKVYRERIRSSLLTPQGRETPKSNPRALPAAAEAAAMACVAALLASPALLPFPSTASYTASASCSCRLRLRPAVVARAPRQQPRGRRALRRFDEVPCVSLLCQWLLPDARGATASCASPSLEGAAPTETLLLCCLWAWGVRARRWRGCRRSGAASEAVAALGGRSRRRRAGTGGLPSILRSRRSEAHRFFCLVYTLQVAQCMLVWRIEYCLTAVVPN